MSIDPAHLRRARLIASLPDAALELLLGRRDGLARLAEDLSDPPAREEDEGERWDGLS